MLATAIASPEAVLRHDKKAWLALFASQAVVEDPVGTAPHADQVAIERFYETFIAPNQISFAVNADYVCGDTVVRDVVIRTQMASGAIIHVPTHIEYRLMEEASQLKVAHLAAHWELRQMLPLVLKQGLRGLRTMLSLGARMLRLQGVAGTLGYSRGMLQGVFSLGHQDVAQLLAAATAPSFTQRFAGNFVGIEWAGTSTLVDLATFRERFAGKLSPGQINAAGFRTSFAFESADLCGIGILEYDSSTRLIQRLRLFS